MSVALVLSGGGSRGAFEVGAALFLYDVYGVRPDIICATSVGSINGAKLAEGGTPDAKRTALEELKTIWLDLKGNGDMWEEAEWLAELGDLQVGDDTIRDLILPTITGQSPLAVHGDTPFFRDNLPWIVDIRGLIGAVGQLVATVPPLREKAEQGKLRSVMRLRPIENKMRGIVSSSGTTTMAPRKVDSTKVSSSGVKLRLAVVSLESGALRYVTEDGQLLERDNATPVLAPESMTKADPACQKMAEKVETLTETLSFLQSKDPPWSATHLNKIKSTKKALADAQKALATCETNHPPTIVTVRPSVDLITAIIASATMPAIFEPRLIGGEYYVDGGVREIAPVKVAFDLGGDQLEQVYVVMASTLNVRRTPSFAGASFFTVLMHSLVDLGLNEIVRDDAFPPRGWPKPCDVIAPSFDLYNPTIVDPGLIRIHSDYGFMRASDVAKRKPSPGPTLLRGLGGGIGGPRGLGGIQPTITPPSTDLTPAKAMQLSDAVTLLRLAAWDAEFDVQSQPHIKLDAPLLPYHPTDMFSALQWIRLVKWLTKAVLDFRVRHVLPMPQFAIIPWLNWEAHPWQSGPVSPTGSPWSEFNTPSGKVENIDSQRYLPQGVLIRDPENGAVYKLWNGARIHIKDPAEFESLGLSWGDVRELPPGAADCLPLEER